MPDFRTKGPAGLNLLTASEMSRRLARGETTSEAIVRDCLARIGARDTLIHAWAHVDPELALFEARARDRETRKGPLHGVPVGIKDVLDTKDMPTEYGSILYRNHRPLADSACVAALRAAGAVIFGKCATTEFAAPYPIATRNPHDLARSPGFSSSGSAAAVADFHIPLALGTQTGGSVIRPATLCGTVGYKASLDGLDRGGIRNLKPTLDTLGFFARSVVDIALLRAATVGGPVGRASVDAPPRVGLCRTPFWRDARPETVAAVEGAAAALAKAGARVTETVLPAAIADLPPRFRVISSREAVAAMEEEAARGWETINPWTRDAVTYGRKCTDAEYQEALAFATRCRDETRAMFADVDVLITPGDRGEAPADLRSIHDSPFNGFWTLLHVPCLTLPSATGPNGMPVGVQVVGPYGADDRTIAMAGWIAGVLGV
ncbi:MAG: amidase [Alphaproteobacteria bacterium]|nr:amidase [Alphaproteobacteria bacterium]